MTPEVPSEQGEMLPYDHPVPTKPSGGRVYFNVEMIIHEGRIWFMHYVRWMAIFSLKLNERPLVVVNNY